MSKRKEAPPMFRSPRDWGDEIERRLDDGQSADQITDDLFRLGVARPATGERVERGIVAHLVDDAVKTRARVAREKGLRETGKSKHTPGPWGVRFMTATDTLSVCTQSNSGGDRPCDEQGRYHIARVSGGAEARANAALIAAAPEMLDALKWICERVGDEDDAHDYIAGVIAKAEGRTDEQA